MLYTVYIGGSGAARLTFNGNGDKTLGGDTEETYYFIKNETCQLPPNTIVHKYITNTYIFKGWSKIRYTAASSIQEDKADYKNNAVVEGGFSNDVTLYALWNKS